MISWDILGKYFCLFYWTPKDLELHTQSLVAAAVLSPVTCVVTVSCLTLVCPTVAVMAPSAMVSFIAFVRKHLYVPTIAAPCCAVWLPADVVVTICSLFHGTTSNLRTIRTLH